MSRTRSRTNKNVTSAFTWYPDPIYGGASSTNYRTEYDYEQLTDNPTAGFHKRIANGEIIIGEMDKLHEYEKISSSSISYHNDPNANQSGYGPAIRHYDNYRSVSAARASLSLASLTSKSRDLAVIAAHANIAKPDAMGLVTAAELGKTLELIRNPLSGLSKWTKRLYEKGWNYRKRNSAKDTLDMVQNTWLEWRYGWRPLVYEIQGFAKAFHHQLTDNGRARSRGHSRLTESKTGLYANGNNYQATCEWFANGSAESWAGVLYDYNLPQSIKYAQLLGLTDVPGSAWELTRYSFVFDWVIDVGSWLRAVTPTLGVTNRHCWVTTTTIDHIYTRMTGVKTGNPAVEYYTTGNGHTLENVITLISRKNGSVPILPPVNIRIDPSKVLDLIFLIRGHGQGIEKLRL